MRCFGHPLDGLHHLPLGQSGLAELLTEFTYRLCTVTPQDGLVVLGNEYEVVVRPKDAPGDELREGVIQATQPQRPEGLPERRGVSLRQPRRRPLKPLARQARGRSSSARATAS